MKPEEPFTCKYCGNPERHDRRKCAVKTLFDNHEWVAKMKKRNSDFLKAKWAKVKQVEGTEP